MKTCKFIFIMVLVALTYACKHPLGVVGNGDVLSATGTRNCYLEDSQAGRKNCSENLISSDRDYVETYYAVPRSGWKFDHWETYCTDGSTGDECAFTIGGDVVKDFAGETMPPLVAVFTPLASRDVTVSWTAPSQRENGTSLSPSELSGYEIHYTAVSTGKSNVVNVNGGQVQSYKVNSLAADLYQFTVVAVDTNNLKSKSPASTQVDLR